MALRRVSHHEWPRSGACLDGKSTASIHPALSVSYDGSPASQPPRMAAKRRLPGWQIHGVDHPSLSVSYDGSPASQPPRMAAKRRLPGWQIHGVDHPALSVSYDGSPASQPPRMSREAAPAWMANPRRRSSFAFRFIRWLSGESATTNGREAAPAWMANPDQEACAGRSSAMAEERAASSFFCISSSSLPPLKVR
jgi:hypothetical protein